MAIVPGQATAVKVTRRTCKQCNPITKSFDVEILFACPTPAYLLKIQMIGDAG
jgi:hypothetical protein